MNSAKSFHAPALDDEIRNYIKKYILDNRLGPGDPLPGETRLAQDLGVGRGTIREAIKALQSLGIVEVRRGDGMYVREYNLDPFLENLRFGMRFETSNLIELAEIRAWLETEIVEESVKRAGPDDVAQIERVIESWRHGAEAGLADPEFVAEQDMSFHRALYHPLHNQILNKLLEVMWLTFLNFLGQYIKPANDLKEHERILEAAQRGLPAEARQCLLQNLETMRGRIHRLLESGQMAGGQIPARGDQIAKPYRRPVLNEAIRDHLKQYILNEGLGAGDPLPSEAQLAQDLGVGRTSVREAIKALESLGIIEVRHGDGLYVREYNFDPVLEVLSYGIRFDARTLVELLEIRSWLEGAVIVEAVDRMTSEDIGRLEDIISRWRSTVRAGKTGPESFAALDEEFHRSLYVCLKNDSLIRLIEVFWVVFAEFIGPYRNEPLVDLADHVAILEAVKSRDKFQARQAVLVNILRNEERMRHLTSIGGSDSPPVSTSSPLSNL